MIDPAPRLITVLGGSGFIGRYVCELLLSAGVRIRVAERDPRRGWFLRSLGEVGQVGFASADLARPASLAPAVEGASAVINLVGILKGNFHAVHVAGARAAAQAARDAGASAFVHISAIGADPNSESDYGRSKGEGEAAVRAAFPAATIIRPSLVFGPEDQLTNRFAGLARFPILPVIAPDIRFQPVYVRDLAEAIAAAALDPATHGGKTYDIAGPQVMTMRELNVAVAKASDQSPTLIDVPDFAADAMSRFGFLPGAPLTRDQWIMLQADNVAAPKSSGLKAFGINPTPLASVAHQWLARFRRGGRFAYSAADA